MNDKTREEELWTVHDLNPLNWASVCSANFDAEKKRKFENQKRAIILRLVDGESMSAIENKTGIKKRQVYRLIERAFTPLENGEPTGFRACIPNYRVKKYERRTHKNSGKAGLMDQLLNKYQLNSKVDKLVLGKVKLDDGPVQGRYFRKIYRKFKIYCEEAGADTITEYPFTNADGGYEAIRNYADKIRNLNFVDAVKVEHGGKVARMAGSSGKKKHYHVNKPLPYQCTQLDGHRLDTIITVTQIDGQGNEQYIPLARLWVIVLVDVASRAVLGYSLSFKENYSSHDVLNCIAHSMQPWKKITSPNPDPLYIKGAGLPGGIHNQCEGRLFNQLRLDNAYAHLSGWLRERIMDIGVNELVYNRPAAPRQNSIVEKIMGTLEEMSFHQMPNTTGSSPDDVRRRKPEKEAAKLKITVEHLIQLVDLTCANYNAQAHHGLNGRSPLEYIEYHLNQPNLPPRKYEGDSIADLSLFERDFPVTIRANKAQGHPPSIKFKGAVYTSDELRLRGDLAKKKATLRVNVNDIRTGILFEQSGAQIGEVSVTDQWSHHEHSLSLRQEILKMIVKRKLTSSEPDPVGAYIVFLKEAAKREKKSRNKLKEIGSSVTTRDISLENKLSPVETDEASNSSPDDDSIVFDRHDLKQ